MSPLITFLSDYGVQDDFVGVCHGVIATICPEARVIDITHGIARHDVRAGAAILAEALPFFPVGVHLAVVDPDVGAERRAVALRLADDRMLVGPDNGLLSRAAVGLGGAIEAVDIAHSRFRLEPVSATFHGRDIFAPVAARLAGGVPLAQVGEPCDPDGLVMIEVPRTVCPRRSARDAHRLCRPVRQRPTRRERRGLCRVRAEVRTAGGAGGCRRPHSEARFARTFAEVPSGGSLLYEDAYRRAAIAVSHGSASERLGLQVDDELRIRPK